MKTANPAKDEKRMLLVRLTRGAQVTIPLELRQRFDLVEGDILAAQASKDGILLRPVSVVARKRKTRASAN